MSAPSPRSAVITAVTPSIFQPAEKAAQLRPQNALVHQSGKKILDGVEHHALGADGVDCRTQANEQAFKIVIAGLVDFAALNANEIDESAFSF